MKYTVIDTIGEETVMAKVNCKHCFGSGAIGTVRGRPVICRCVKVVKVKKDD